VGNDSYVLDKRVFFLSLAKRFDEALELLVELRNRDPKNARYLYMTGSQYYEQQKYAQALPWFESGLQLNPRHIKMWWRIAYAQHCSGNETAACAAASQVLKIWSGLPKDEQDRSLSVRAKALHLLGKTYLTYHPHLALPLLEQAVLDAPNDTYNLYCLGKAQRVMARPEEALATQRRAIKLKPADPHIRLELAICMGRTGDREGALAMLSRLSGRLAGWEAYKAARAADMARAIRLAGDFMQRAQGDRLVREDGEASRFFAKVRAELRNSPNLPSAMPNTLGTGKIAVLRVDRGFGFVVDDKDGLRRHFRIKGNAELQLGDRVRFERLEAEKGPAARSVTRV
jgi:tetratricopeptide (TPR) repeat protein/cold shock CspA family protein